jgi:hypothetical protein
VHECIVADVLSWQFTVNGDQFTETELQTSDCIIYNNYLTLTSNTYTAIKLPDLVVVQDGANPYMATTIEESR